MPIQTPFDLAFLEKATESLRAVAHPIRLGIIDLLFHNEQLSVTEIYETLKIEQAVASHHLRIMKDRNIVAVVRDGKNANYYLTDKDYYQIVDALTKLI
ncbi:MAG: metalloregulator ArsR/SmtB family transcription factor [Bacteroidota bacterium]